MNSPMTVFSMMGFLITVLGTGLFIASVGILAVFGGHTLWRLTLRGAETTEREMADGHTYRSVMRGVAHDRN